MLASVFGLYNELGEKRGGLVLLCIMTKLFQNHIILEQTAGVIESVGPLTWRQLQPGITPGKVTRTSALR